MAWWKLTDADLREDSSMETLNLSQGSVGNLEPFHKAAWVTLNLVNIEFNLNLST